MPKPVPCDMPGCGNQAVPGRSLDMCRDHWDEFKQWQQEKLDEHH